MTAVFWLINAVLNIAWWIVILHVVFSWLYQFNVINSGNQLVSSIGNFLYRATEPLLSPIRRFIPTLGGLDFSPIVLLLGITFLQILIRTSVAPAFGVFSY